ncbi:thioredoxin-dependent thiol peroxidase [Paenibacillus sp. NEAU-GSW1]|uniref:thioredoxin-dependent thiol peroxidase n=1 Tax=Paenibacillus sp. NEAU-GSW1 TaxID=2682486 RepID=UPI0012E1C7E0|nr:thioredoxin-dependent thiol peroxidase [Paenibacillus sp. NEAU-GSW1]MUT66595.1 thioredoxin-dependent thiol peroxidase [Paenibacillus sp. NEAU-GSW1]
MSGQVQIGQQVPDFTLPASTGQAISLKDYRGKKLVIYFYPKDMTPGCTVESCDFRDYNGQFETNNTAVIGISPDDLASHDEFIAKHELPFPLLSDTTHEVSELFGVWKLRSWNGNEFMGIERSTFLIDEQGMLAEEWRSVDVDGHVQQVLEAAKQ